MQVSNVATSIILATGLLLTAGHVSAKNVNIKLEPYVTGVNAPVAMVQPDGDDRKLTFAILLLINSPTSMSVDFWV